MCVLYCPVTCEPRCEHSFTLVEAVQLGRLLERQQAGQEEADEQAGAGHWEQRQRTAAAVDSHCRLPRVNIQASTLAATLRAP